MTEAHDADGPEVGVDLSFPGTELAGLQFRLPGMTEQEITEANFLVNAGEMDTEPVRRFQKALLESLEAGQVDGWRPGDDAALLLEANGLGGGELS